MLYPNLILVISLVALFSQFGCERLNNEYEDIALSCQTSRTKPTESAFVKINENSSLETSKWQGIVVKPGGNSQYLQTTPSQCIVVPINALSQDSRLIIRDQLSSRYKEINLQTLEANQITHMDATNSTRVNPQSSLILSCPRQTIYTNGDFYLQSESVDSKVFELTYHKQTITSHDGKTVYHLDMILPSTTAQKIDLSKAELPDGEYILETKNQGIFEGSKIFKQSRCKIQLDRVPPQS
jgi:hypothetical protein